MINSVYASSLFTKKKEEEGQARPHRSTGMDVGEANSF